MEGAVAARRLREEQVFPVMLLLFRQQLIQLVDELVK